MNYKAKLFPGQTVCTIKSLDVEQGDFVYFKSVLKMGS